MTTSLKDPVRKPPTAPEGGGGGDRWVLLVVARDHITAHLISGRLHEDGIESRLDTSNPAPGAWLHPFGNPMAPVKVFVLERDLEWGRLIIGRPEPERSALSDSRPGFRLVLYLIITLAVAATLTVLEIVDFAPCRIGLFCF